MGSGYYQQQVYVGTQRLYDGENAGKWLVSISTGLTHNRGQRGYGYDLSGRSLDTVPQCLCVVDDFGNLVPVRGWH